jgi:mono/diheme cytochrome c family protein
LRLAALLGVGVCLLFAAGCRQEMADQPSYKPLQESTFFRDGRSARPLEPGTVARGQLDADSLLPDGADEAAETGWDAGLVGVGGNVWSTAAWLPVEPGNTFPFPVTEAVLKRGQERYNIYCSVCHDRLGTGHGKIVERGYLRPPSYHTDRLRRAPLSHFYEVVTHGYGAMPDYASQIPATDRWAIIAYVRALQLSQNVPMSRDEMEQRLKEERLRKEKP